MTARPSTLALTSLLLFLDLFLGTGLYFTAQGDAMGFYQLHGALPRVLAAVTVLFTRWPARRGIAAAKGKA